MPGRRQAEEAAVHHPEVDVLPICFITGVFQSELKGVRVQSLGALACKMWLEQLAFKATFWSGTRNQCHKTKSHVSFVWFAVKCPCVTLFSHSFLCCHLNLISTKNGYFTLSHSSLFWGFKDRFKPHELALRMKSV